jgi:hypothetical protein
VNLPAQETVVGKVHSALLPISKIITGAFAHPLQHWRELVRTLAMVVALVLPLAVLADASVVLKYTRAEIENKWHARIQSFLDQGKVPLIGLLSFLPQENSDKVIASTKAVMDKRAVALISFAGYEAPEGSGDRGYRWSHNLHRIVNADPDRFILTTNKGGNRNWFNQKGGKPRHFIDQLEQEVRGGDYAFIGQVEFRHYPSNNQCKRGEAQRRDIDIPLNGDNGHRLFRLAADTGIPVAIHLEPEDRVLATLEEMLAAYPKAKIIVSHFGQLRHPERQTQFGPKLVERLLRTYPNLYYDLSTGEPGRVYRCGDYRVQDTVLWEAAPGGGQKKSLKADYRQLLTQFSDRFVIGFDYGAANRNSAAYLNSRIDNVRLILRDLPLPAQNDIAWRNAWRLLTGRPWK